MRAMKDSGVQWIGVIPSEWDLRRLKYVVSLRNKKIDDNDLLIPYIGLEHVACENGALINGYTPITNFNGDTIEFKRNDILFGKLRPYLAKALRTAFDGKCSSEFWVMEPKRVDAQFLLYSVLSSSFLSCIDHSTFGVKMPRAEWSFASNQLLSLPPAMEEQSRIADFLDTKCVEIDTLIAAKEKTNALLKEQRQSIIYEAVTKGLDPNAPMKDSGVEWIGEMPERWEITRLRSRYTFGKGLPITKADLVDDGIGVVSYGQIHSKDNAGFMLKDSLVRFVSPNFLKSCKSALVHQGDVIFADTSEDLEGCGNCVFVDRTTDLFAGYHTLFLKPRSSTYNRFFAYLFLTNAWRSQIRQAVTGVKLFSITQNILKNTLVVEPSEIEKSRIADYLDAKCAEIDALIAANNITIQKLKEYRQSVIYEAVTGKVEV